MEIFNNIIKLNIKNYPILKGKIIFLLTINKRLSLSENL